MKKLKLNLAAEKEILTKEQMKKITGGSSSCYKCAKICGISITYMYSGPDGCGYGYNYTQYCYSYGCVCMFDHVITTPPPCGWA